MWLSFKLIVGAARRIVNFGRSREISIQKNAVAVVPINIELGVWACFGSVFLLEMTCSRVIACYNHPSNVNHCEMPSLRVNPHSHFEVELVLLT